MSTDWYAQVPVRSVCKFRTGSLSVFGMKMAQIRQQIVRRSRTQIPGDNVAETPIREVLSTTKMRRVRKKLPVYV